MNTNRTTDRRAFLKLLGMGALSSCVSSPAFGGRQGSGKPNILFMVVDDLRPQLGCYGHEETLSPNIDRLASRGTVFKRAYCQVPVCGPSRVSVLTGIRTDASQWRCRDLETPFVTLPAHFRAQGYHAVSNGKVLHHMDDRREDWSEPPWRSAPIYHGEGDWAGYNTHKLWWNEESGKSVNPRSGRGPYCEFADVPDNAYQDGKVAEKTIADLKRLKETGKPFFMACGFWRPHLPFNAPKKYWDWYEREKVAVAANRFRPANLPQACRDSTEINRYGRVEGRKSSLDFHREARHAYFACVGYVDAQIGKVLDALEALGLRENTVVVLWGDHGWHLGEHDFWGKHNTLHNALHAPLIVSAPQSGRKNATEALVEFVDIYPSLCALAGIPVPGHVQGTSFVPLLENPRLPWKKGAFSRWTDCASVKTDRYLYTEWKKDGQVTARMLFDHNDDPEENENIADKPECRALTESLSRLLKDGWQKARPARQPLPDGK